MARLLDYAAFAQHTYDSTNGLYKAITGTTHIQNFHPRHPGRGGWQQVHLLSRQFAQHHSFYAELFVLIEHQKAIEAVIAYRGTILTQLRNDWSDIKITAFHELPLNFSQAVKFYDRSRHFLLKQFGHLIPISTTGHSLGGIIAKLIAIKKNCKAVAFNAPGIGEQKLVNPHHDYSHQIVNIATTKGEINKIGEHIGQISLVPVKEGEEQLKHIQAQTAWAKQFPNQKQPGLISTLSERFLASVEKHHMSTLLQTLIHMPAPTRPTLPWRQR